MGDLPRRIVIADPEVETRARFADRLRLEAYEVAEAADGREALVRALGRPPELVLTEVRLPSRPDSPHHERAG